MHTAAAVAAAVAIHLIPNPPTSCKTESTNGHSHTNIYTHTHTHSDTEGVTQTGTQTALLLLHQSRRKLSLIDIDFDALCVRPTWGDSGEFMRGVVNVRWKRKATSAATRATRACGAKFIEKRNERAQKKMKRKAAATTINKTWQRRWHRPVTACRHCGVVSRG